MAVRLCLNMIVKNEEQVIRRCLESVKPHIDYWVICDTGSTDNTRQVITETMQDVPGELHEHEWVNFGVNRTKALQIAKSKADYLLFMDADMIVTKHTEFKSELNADSYLIRYTGSLDYWQTMLVSTKIDWKYVGPTHEYIAGNSNMASIKLNALTLTHFADGGERKNKFTRDIELLKKALVHDPNNTRYLFYLAQSYGNLDAYDEAITYYKKRLEYRGWEEEFWFSQYQIGVMLEKSGANSSSIHDAYLKAFELRPSRMEPLYRLVRWLRSQERFELALIYAKKALTIPYPRDILFIEKNVYSYLLLFEFAICAHYAGNPDDAILANDMVIGNPLTPYAIAKQATVNKHFSLKKFISQNSSQTIKRLATVSYDLNIICGSGISLTNFITNLENQQWSVLKSNYFPDIQAFLNFGPQGILSQQWAMKKAYHYAELLKVPLLVFVRGSGQYEYCIQENIKPDYVLFCSSHEYFKVKQKYPSIKGIVSHPLIAAPKNTIPSKKTFITLIGNNKIKGIDIFLKIAKKLPEEKFMFVGDSIENEVLPENVVRHEITSAIDTIYTQTKLLLVPSINESYGRIVVEAAYHDIVTIATDCPGIREASGFSNAIYISDRNDIGLWVERIKTVLNNSGEYTQMPRRIVEGLQSNLEMEYARIKLAGWMNSG
ncbi:MAG: glycosyltransferase [Bacteroidota bacterium]